MRKGYDEGWKRSDAYAELLDAASAVGVAVDPLARTEAAWGLTLAESTRVHAEWSRRMRARAGVPERGEGDLEPEVHYSRRGSDEAVARREAAKLAHWAAADTLTNRVLSLLPADPDEALTGRGLTVALGLDPRSMQGRTALAVTSSLYGRGALGRRPVPRQGPGPRTEWAYFRVA